MPVYSFVCESCGACKEELMTVNEPHVCRCECGSNMARDWHSDIPMIAGDTCAGGCQYAGYDEGLGEYVIGPRHRREIMKRKGLVPYEPDPNMQAYRDDINYVKKHSLPTEPGAKEKVRALRKESGKARRKAIISRELAKRPLKQFAGE